MDEMVPAGSNLDAVYAQVRQILSEARTRAWQAVNTAMVTAYWEVGRTIVEEEQRGKSRAEYGKQLIEELSRRLSAELGRGFSRANLWDMRSFYQAFPILQTLSRELTWSHYRLLLRVDRPEA